MQQDIITQRQFLEKYRNGERRFSDSLFQSVDVSNIDFNDLVISNCKFMDSSFTTCNMKNVRFEKCEFFYMGFYNSKLSGVVFENCTMEISLFDHIQFEKCSMKACYLRMVGILWSNHALLDMTTTTQSMVVTDLSQLTGSYIEEAISDVVLHISRMDVSTRLRIKESIHRHIDRFNLESPKEKDSNAYKNDGNADNNVTYGEVKQMLGAVFSRYGQQDTYRSDKKHSAYETREKYK